MAGFFGELARKALDAPRSLRPVMLAPRLGPDAEAVDESVEPDLPTTGTSGTGRQIDTQLNPAQSSAIPTATGITAGPRDLVPGQPPGAASPPTLPMPPSATQETADNAGRLSPRHRIPAATPEIKAGPSDTVPRKPATVDPTDAASDAPKAIRETATPLRPATLPTAGVAAAASDRRSRSPLVAADTVPDVHIHIGRIELTAPGAGPKPAKRKAEAAMKPMSLDEYLQHRRGKSP